MANCGGSCSKAPVEEKKEKILTVSVEKGSIISKVQGDTHTFYSDETPTWGGKDQYPDPWDYIIGGLGSCIAISLRQYANNSPTSSTLTLKPNAIVLLQVTS